MAVTGLLFLAFAFFTVAQASTVRNGGQSAADAAAIGAAKDDRDQLFDGFSDAVEDEEDWQDWLTGEADIAAEGCSEAEYFAGRNRSDVTACQAVTREGNPGYSVHVLTRYDTGETIIPGTENKKAKASATAVVEPLCDFDDGSDPREISCNDQEFTIDPGDDIDLRPSDLFSVILVD